MSDWNRTIDLYLDINKQATSENALLKVDGNAISVGGEPVFIKGDYFTLRLHFYKLDTAGTTVLEVPAGGALVFDAKKRTDLAAGDSLFGSESFIESGTGDDVLYSADIDLNGTALNTAMSGVDELDVRCDVELQNADNSRRVTLQFDAVVKREVYATTDSIPLTVQPDRAYRINDGEFQLYNPDQSKWHTLYVSGTAGAETLTIGPGEA